MKTGNRADKRRNPAAPESPAFDRSDAMMADERLAFEDEIVHDDEQESPIDPADDPDRMTKSGRLKPAQLKKGD